MTDALRELAADPDGPGVYGVVFSGRRYDTGDRVDYIKAILQLACDRDDLGPELRPWLKQFAAGFDADGDAPTEPSVLASSAQS